MGFGSLLGGFLLGDAWQMPSSCCSHRQPGNGWGPGEEKQQRYQAEIACWNGSSSKLIYKMSNKVPLKASGLLILLPQGDACNVDTRKTWVCVGNVGFVPWKRR